MRLPKSIFNLAGLMIAWIVIFGIFSVLRPESFPTWENFILLLRQAAIVGVVTLGMTYVIMSGGIDLSVGSTAAFSSVAIAWGMRAGYPPMLSLLLGLLAGLLAGFVNGTLITSLKVGPFIVTLGTLLIMRGLAKGLGEEKKIDAPLSWLNDLLAKVPAERSWQLFPAGVWIILILAVLMAWVLHSTRFGRHVVAVGSNEHAARLCGVPIERTKVFVFMLSGFFAGVAGLLYFSRLTVGDPTIAAGLELDVIAAAVIGGASLSGGQGSIAGSLLGALIMATIRAGGSQYNLPNWVQEIVTGAIIVLAVALDRFRVKAGN